MELATASLPPHLPSQKIKPAWHMTSNTKHQHKITTITHQQLPEGHPACLVHAVRSSIDITGKLLQGTERVLVCGMRHITTTALVDQRVDLDENWQTMATLVRRTQYSLRFRSQTRTDGSLLIVSRKGYCFIENELSILKITRGRRTGRDGAAFCGCLSQLHKWGAASKRRHACFRY